MLTGDKIETAKCIAIATGLQDNKQKVFEMVQLTTKKSVQNHIDEYRKCNG